MTVDAARLVEHLGPEAWLQEPMAEHTTLRIGGAADVFVRVRSVLQLVQAVRLARQARLPYLLLGEGANILVADAGVRGMVIENRAQSVTVYCRAAGIQVVAEAGAPLAELARYCTRRGIGGLEWAVDVPGSLGGALVGNAGAYGGRMSDLLVECSVLTPDERVLALSKDEVGFGYRTSKLKQEERRQEERTVVLSATLALPWGVREILEEQAAEFTRRRWERQPAEPSAGSIFKRTADYPAGYLIEQVGLKGLQLNQAQISPRHANVIINLGGARAADVKVLMDLARTLVRERFGQVLEPEIELIGDWPAEPATPPPWQPG